MLDATNTTLPNLAAEHLRKAEGDTAEATRSLIALLTGDPSVRAAVIDAAVEEAARSMVGHAMRAERAAIWSGRAPTPKTSVTAFAGGMARSLLDFPLAGGLRLGDATREEVAAQAALYAALRDDAARKARWLTAIAAALPEGARVRDAMTEAQVSALREEADQ